MKIKRCMLKCQAVNGGNMENDMCELFTLLQSSSGAVRLGLLQHPYFSSLAWDSVSSMGIFKSSDMYVESTGFLKQFQMKGTLMCHLSPCQSYFSKKLL